MRNKIISLILVIFVVVGFGYYFLTESSNHLTSHTDTHNADSNKSNAGYWTCSMHPSVHMDEPGSCPICGMDLIHVEPDTDSDDFDVGSASEPDSNLSSDAFLWQCKDYPDVTSYKQEICPIDGTEMIMITKDKPDSAGEIVAKLKIKKSQIDHFRPTVISASKMNMKKRVRLLGKVVKSEERESNIPAKIGGRIDKVYIKYTGSFVSTGDPVVLLYSPELVTAGEEYLVAKKRYDENKTDDYKTLAEQAKEKLLLWGIKEFQIDKWLSEKSIPEQIVIYSPVSGIVTRKNVVAGSYVQTGYSLYDIADLSSVWVEMDLYEKDLAVGHIGTKVYINFIAYPGEIWESEIDFVSPLLNENSRTLNIRATIKNPNSKLKPGMTGEAVLELDLADSLLAVPRTAVIDTGERKVVWIDLGNNRYIAKTVITGMESEGYLEIKKGLMEGEKVILDGNFMLDSQAQIFGGYIDKDPNPAEHVHNH